MTDPLQWREARREDRLLLQGFTCARKPPPVYGKRIRVPNPLEYERVVEKQIRKVNPVTNELGTIRLGLSGSELVSVACLEWTEGGQAIEFQVAAVDLRFQGKKYGHQVAQDAIRWAMAQGAAADFDTITVIARIDPRNERSRGLLISKDFSEGSDGFFRGIFFTT